jgi:hypothetical protein
MLFGVKMVHFAPNNIMYYSLHKTFYTRVFVTGDCPYIVLDDADLYRLECY